MEVSSPIRVLVFLLATILLIIVEVEVIEGWHLIHLFELLGIMLVLYWVGQRGVSHEF